MFVKIQLKVDLNYNIKVLYELNFERKFIIYDVLCLVWFSTINIFNEMISEKLTVIFKIVFAK